MACALSLCRTMAKDSNNVPGVRGHISISVQGMTPLKFPGAALPELVGQSTCREVSTEEVWLLKLVRSRRNAATCAPSDAEGPCQCHMCRG